MSHAARSERGDAKNCDPGRMPIFVDWDLGGPYEGLPTDDCLTVTRDQSLWRLFFLEGDAMNLIEKSAITTKAYRVRVYRICPNFAQ